MMILEESLTCSREQFNKCNYIIINENENYIDACGKYFERFLKIKFDWGEGLLKDDPNILEDFFRSFDNPNQLKIFKHIFAYSKNDFFRLKIISLFPWLSQYFIEMSDKIKSPKVIEHLIRAIIKRSCETFDHEQVVNLIENKNLDCGQILEIYSDSSIGSSKFEWAKRIADEIIDNKRIKNDNIAKGLIKIIDQSYGKNFLNNYNQKLALKARIFKTFKSWFTFNKLLIGMMPYIWTVAYLLILVV